MSLANGSGTVRTAKVVKANDSEEGENVAFTIEGVAIAPDGTEAPIAVQADAASAKAAPKRKLPDRAKRSWEALTETLLNHGKPAPQSFGLPVGIKVAALDDWRDELCSRNILEKDSENRQRDFQRIQDQLAARELIGIRDNHVWQAAT